MRLAVAPITGVEMAGVSPIPLAADVVAYVREVFDVANQRVTARLDRMPSTRDNNRHGCRHRCTFRWRRLALGTMGDRGHRHYRQLSPRRRAPSNKGGPTSK